MEYEQLLRSILEKIVDYPSAMDIRREKDGDDILLIVDPCDQDAPLVIGSEGRVVGALKDIFYIIGASQEKGNIYIALDVPEK